jgi:hypothetical protein
LQLQVYATALFVINLFTISITSFMTYALCQELSYSTFFAIWALVVIGIIFPLFNCKSSIKIFTIENSLLVQRKILIPYAFSASLMGFVVGGVAYAMAGFTPSLFVGLFFTIIAFFNLMRIGSYLKLLQITTPYQRFTASAKALHFSILQHWLLRWQLYRAGVLPLRLVHFLHEMTARHLLETDGATWLFRHRILQEYFARQWREH